VSSNRPWLPAAIVTAAIALLVAWPVLHAPFVEIIGQEMSPGYDHLWGLWVTAERLWTNGPFVRNAPDVGFPEGFYALQYEVPNLLFFLPGYWLGGGSLHGAALGWNLLQVGALVAGAAGCWLLGRDLLGPTPALAVLVAVFAGSPFLLALPYMEHSEYLASVLWPWHLWALHRWLSGGRWTYGVGAGLILGAMAATASYLPVFLAILEPPIGVALAWQRRAWGRLAVVALVALPIGGAFGWEMMQPWPHGHGAFADWGIGTTRPAPSLAMMLSGMLRLWPGPPPTEFNEQAAYPGLVAIGLAVAGAWRSRPARWWGLLGLGAFVLGVGTMVEFYGRRWLLPAGMLQRLVPQLGLVHFWQRIAPLAALPLGIAAATGATFLVGATRFRAPVALLLATLVVADQATFPRGLVLPPPSCRIDPLPDLTRLLSLVPEGALLQYPLPVINMPGPPVSTGPYLVWQMSHRRPISARQNLQGDVTLATSYLARIVANRQALPVQTTRGRPVGPDPATLVGAGDLSLSELECARADAASLRARGFSAAVLYLRVGRGEMLEPLLTSVLGEPLSGEDVRVYPLPDAGEPAASCPLPDPARVVASVLGSR
jgi:hypothetical protein